MDTFFEAVSCAQRRRLLVALLDHNPQELPLADHERRISLTDEREKLAQYHTHLPKLVEFGYVEWDRSAGVVTRGPRFEAIRPALELVVDSRDCFPDD